MLSDIDIEELSIASTYIGFILLQNKQYYALVNAIAGYLLVELIKEPEKAYPEKIYFQALVVAACIHLANSLSTNTVEKKLFVSSIVFASYFLIQKIQR